MNNFTTKKRVLFLASSAPRYDGDGTAPFILNMAQDLTEIGWQVDILAPHAQGIQKKEEIGNVTIHRFQYMWPGNLQTLCYNGGVNANLKASKWNYLLIPFFIFFQFWAARSLIRSQKYNLIHSHWIIPQGINGYLLSKIFHIPHIIFAHGGDIFGLNNVLLKKLKTLILNAADIVITNSTYSKEEMTSFYAKEPVYVIPTGTTPAPPPTEPKPAHQDLQLIFVGRLTEEKGLRYLLQAIKELSKFTNIHLTIIGDGRRRKAYEKYVEENTLTNYITFTGQIAHEEVFDHMKKSDIFVAPSVTTSNWTEAQGNTIIEAMFCGTPVIASNIGGITDAVIHEETGILVTEKSPSEIQKAILRLSDDKQLCAKLVENAYYHAHEFFSRYNSAQKIAHIYDEVYDRI